MANKESSKKRKAQNAKRETQSSPKNIGVGGSVTGDHIVIGNNNVIHYYAADGEKREMRTGWFYGHRYGDLATFTGRADELKKLDNWLANDTDNLLLMTAFGGFGKSALTWQWFNNRVDKTKWQTAVWWSFYEKESGFESFLAETLNHLGVEVKASARLQLNDLLEAMRGTNILIVLDGFERLLRQYGRMDAALQSDDEDAEIDPSQRDCSSPLTETFLRGLSGAGMNSKVLMTTRLCPRVLESADGKLLKGCREEALSAFSPEDAVTYFHNEGIKATRAEVIEACAAYGYHPLSLSLLVGLINADHERGGDIAAVKNLEIFADVKARRHHVLERAYSSLAPERRDLLSKMSCFRGSMEYAVLKKVFPSPDLDRALLDLRQRGLLQYADETGRYDMHPIVRHYAYDRLTAEEKRSVHERLVNYFEAITEPKKVEKLEDLAPAFELYYHMVRAGKLDEALIFFRERLPDTIYYQFSAYQLVIELLTLLFTDSENKLPSLRYESDQTWTLNTLAIAYSMNGQPRNAVPLFEKIIQVDKTNNDRSKNAAVTLGASASTGYLPTGALREAVINLRKSIELCVEIGYFFGAASGLQELGRVMSYCGAWQEAQQELDTSLELWERQNGIQSESVVWSYRALWYLLLTRENPILSLSLGESIIKSAQRALELAEETARQRYPHPVDYMRAYWLLGAAYRENRDLNQAEENLSKALNLCRQINLVEMEADILLDVARLRYSQGDFKDAQEKASEALVITERCGYVLQGADVHLFLAELAMTGITNEGLGISGDAKAVAKNHAEAALKLAYCDGPPYYYKVTYEEAERMLEMLK